MAQFDASATQSLAGPRARSRSATPRGPRELDPLHDLAGAHEDRRKPCPRVRRRRWRSVHPVGEVDVQRPAVRTSPGCAGSVRGRRANRGRLPVVRLDLGQPDGDPAVAQVGAQRRPRGPAAEQVTRSGTQPSTRGQLGSCSRPGPERSHRVRADGPSPRSVSTSRTPGSSAGRSRRTARR